MRRIAILIVLLALSAFLVGCGQKTEPTSLPPPATQTYISPPALKIQPTDFVNLKEYIPTVEVELIYFTENNFTKQKLYDNPTAYLRKGTADKLKKVAEEVAERGYRLKIWDAYRPPRIQFKMWEAFPDSRYVANPHKGFSFHSRGCAIDLTLVNSNGIALDMPSAFDEFSLKANRDYSDVSPIQSANARYLEEVMVKQGFRSIQTEWWHFVDADEENYDVAQDDVLP